MTERTGQCPRSLSGTHLWITSDGHLALDYYSHTVGVEDQYCLCCGAYRQTVNPQVNREQRGRE